MTLSELEEEARKRKERLLQWKLNKQNRNEKRKEYDDEDENSNDQQNEKQNQDDQFEENSLNKNEKFDFPKPIFRNYKPHDSGPLSGAIILPKPKLIDVKSLIDDQFKGKLSLNESNPNMFNEITENVDLLSLAPRKPDWDLKRDVDKKLKRLEKRTSRSIAELTRERLLSQQKQSQISFAEVISTTSRLNEINQDDDFDENS